MVSWNDRNEVERPHIERRISNRLRIVRRCSLLDKQSFPAAARNCQWTISIFSGLRKATPPCRSYVCNYAASCSHSCIAGLRSTARNTKSDVFRETWKYRGNRLNFNRTVIRVSRTIRIQRDYQMQRSVLYCVLIATGSCLMRFFEHKGMWEIIDYTEIIM